MERSKYLCFILFLSLISISNSNVWAQRNNSSDIYNAYITGDMGKWKSAMDQMEKENPGSPDRKLELIGYYYGYTAYLIGLGNKDKEAKANIEKAEKLIKDVLNQSPQNATALAYKGSFIGYKISLNKVKAMIIGPESINSINKAYKIDPENVQAVADKANLMHYAPGAFGGDKAGALELYEKGIRLMEKRNQTHENWFYLSLMTSLARRYEEAGQYDKAKTMYEKILRVEPRFKWVKDELYPSLLTLMRNK